MYPHYAHERETSVAILESNSWYLNPHACIYTILNESVIDDVDEGKYVIIEGLGKGQGSLLYFFVYVRRMFWGNVGEG